MHRTFLFANVVARLRGAADAWAHACGGIARVNARLTRRAASPRALIGQLGIITTCVTIFAPPITYATISALQLQQRAEEQTMLGARHVEVQLTQQGSVDRLNQVSINVLHATRSPNSVVAASWVTDDAGTTLMFQGRPTAWPEMRASKPIRTPHFKGHFHIAVSTREVFVGTFYVAAGFLILGLAAYYGFRRLPLAGLDRAQHLLDVKQSELLSQKSQLEMQNLRFDAALNNMSQGLCMCDGEHRLVVCNAPYVRMYALPPELVQPGTPFADIIRHRLATGLHAEQSPDDYMRDLREIIARAQAGDQDPRAQRRAHHRHQASADAGQGLALHARGHDRVSPHRSARRPHGAPRHSDRAAQPHAAARAHGAGARWRAKGQEPGGALSRPRPLQGHQRYARPPRRRCLAEGRRRKAARLRRGRRHGRQGGRGRVLRRADRDRPAGCRHGRWPTASSPRSASLSISAAIRSRSEPASASP